MKNFYVRVILLGLFHIIIVLAEDKHIKKRQIYREQVLPHAGGKIPDTAFQTDRLLLNQLQKEGISIPDGVILQQRNPQVHPYYNRASRTVFRVAVTSDGRYIPVEGRYVYEQTPSQETTYLYPQIHNHPLYAPSILNTNLPKYRTLTLPNKYLAPDTLKPKKKTVYLVSYGGAKQFQNAANSPIQYSVSNTLKQPIQSINTYNLINTPTRAFSWSQLQQDYITTQIFNDFDGFFNQYKGRGARSSIHNTKEKYSRLK